MSRRIDPVKAGPSTCCADIGVHAQHLISYVTGLKMQEISADMTVTGVNRVLDTDFTATIRYESGVKGHLWCSNVAAGKYNDLNIAIYGTKGSFAWSLEEPDIVTFGGIPGQTILYRMGKTSASGEQGKLLRLPAGQSEGYYLAFANIYRSFMRTLSGEDGNQPLDEPYPTVDDGIESLRFVEACIASTEAGGAWMKLDG